MFGVYIVIVSWTSNLRQNIIKLKSRTTIEQKLDDFCISGRTGIHERRDSVHVLCIDVRLGVDQNPDVIQNPGQTSVVKRNKTCQISHSLKNVHLSQIATCHFHIHVRHVCPWHLSSFLSYYVLLLCLILTAMCAPMWQQNVETLSRSE